MKQILPGRFRGQPANLLTSEGVGAGIGALQEKSDSGALGGEAALWTWRPGAGDSWSPPLPRHARLAGRQWSGLSAESPPPNSVWYGAPGIRQSDRTSGAVSLREMRYRYPVPPRPG
jgi:hypothetical protein